MSDLKYDPEFPYVVPDFSGGIIAKFEEKRMADWYAENHPTYGTVIDTTPKPKIPEDAEYILWQLDGEISMAYKGGGSYDWYSNSEAWTHEQLLEEVADAEVTVLVRKEES